MGLDKDLNKAKTLAAQNAIKFLARQVKIGLSMPTRCAASLALSA
jgi:hypothetical protein